MPSASFGARIAALGMLATAGCIYPSTDPTGLELSWRFVESEPSDGDEARRVRSCAGAQTEQIAVDVQDQDAPARRARFRFDCVAGYQTATALQTEASDAFIRLDPGPYTVTMFAVDDATNAPDDERLEARDIEVEARDITIATWELRRAAVDWTVELRGGAECERLAMALYYATPEQDLAEYVADDDQSLPLYRQALVSDRGLALTGRAAACSDQLDGPHVFAGLDRGEYVLDLGVDQRQCAVRLDLRDRAGAARVIDLANPPCGG